MKRKITCLMLAALMLLSAGKVMENMKVNAAQPVRKSEMGMITAQGVWHRPNITGTETNLAGIRTVLDVFQETGINLVFLETFYHGMTVFKSSYIEYYKGFEAFDYSPYPDYLSAFVAEAEKRGIEVHAWVEDFYIGVNENHFTRHLPEWLMLTKDGGIRQTEGAEYGGYLFLDPANPAVRQYLLQFYDEILTKFPQIAGLNLDYIRYPISSQGDDTGFTDAAMNGFAAKEGISFPENATREEKTAMISANYGQWVNYRAEQITTFVGQVYEMVKTEHKGVLLSTAVFPEQGKSFGDKKQDFNTWLSRGYLDIITPMAYYDDIGTLKNALEAMLPGLSACYCYAGISPTYHNLPNSTVLKQMATTLEAGADGFVHFGSQSILQKPNYIQLLKENTTQTVLPHSEAKVLLNTAAKAVESKLVAAGEPKQTMDSLLDFLKELEKTQDLREVNKQLRLLVKYNLGNYVSSKNESLIREDLEQLYRCVDVMAARLEGKGQLPTVPDEPAKPTTPTTRPTTKPTEPPVSSTEPAVSTQPTTEPSKPVAPETPDEPQDTPNNEKRPTGTAKMLGMGMILATLAVAGGTAGFFAIRKGRKK